MTLSNIKYVLPRILDNPTGSGPFLGYDRSDAMWQIFLLQEAGPMVLVDARLLDRLLFKWQLMCENFRERLFDRYAAIFEGEKVPLDIINACSGELIIPANRKITKTLLRKMVKQIWEVECDPSPIRNKIVEIRCEVSKVLNWRWVE